MKKLVSPGKKICVIEEYTPGDGCYIDSGNIRAKKMGIIKKSNETKTVSIIPMRKIKHDLMSDVIGRIIAVVGVFGIIEVNIVNDKPLNSPISGYVYPIREFIRGKKQFKINDIVLGYIKSTKNRTFHFYIDGMRYGVIKALCSKCGSLMEAKQKQDSYIICITCRNREERKTSSLYGTII